MTNKPVFSMPIMAAYLLNAAVFVFACIGGAAQYWRSDLDPITVPLSIYLTGPGGVYLRMVYYLMALALVAFAAGSHAATSSAQRSVLASLLFAFAGLALPVVAVTELFAGTAYENLARLLHGLTAQATFISLSFAMLLLSSRWRHDPYFNRSHWTGITLAWLAFIVLWLQSLVRSLPHGLMQKLLIVLMLLWLAWAARQLLYAVRYRTSISDGPQNA